MEASDIAPVSKEKVEEHHPVRKLAKGAKYPMGKAKVKLKMKGTADEVHRAIKTMAGR